jgi:hypothetical protein
MLQYATVVPCVASACRSKVVRSQLRHRFLAGDVLIGDVLIKDAEGSKGRAPFVEVGQQDPHRQER